MYSHISKILCFILECESLNVVTCAEETKNNNNSNNNQQTSPYSTHIEDKQQQQQSSDNNKTTDVFKPTRIRTVLSDKQVAILKTCYAANSRPDALMKEQLVELTGLSLRVIRVWFQNKRCKDKKKSVTISKQKSVVRIFSYFGISLNEENFSQFVKKNKFYVADENFFFTEIFFFFLV